jgi:hypothetical protein
MPIRITLSVYKMGKINKIQRKILKLCDIYFNIEKTILHSYTYLLLLSLYLISRGFFWAQGRAQMVECLLSKHKIGSEFKPTAELRGKIFLYHSTF